MALKTEKYRKYYLKCSNTFLAGCIFFVGKTLYEYIDSSWNFDSICTTCNDRSRNREMLSAVWRWFYRLAALEREVFVQSRFHALRLSRVKVHERAFGGQFWNDGQVQTAVLSWFRDQGVIFNRQDIERLVESSKKCFQWLKDCVEKKCVFCVTHCILVQLSIKYFLTYIIRV